MTLVELIVSMTVISIGLVGTLMLMNFTTSHSADPMIQHQAIAIAEAYLEEVLLKSYYDPDLGSGGGICPTPIEATRDLYDNVCDYNTLADSGAKDHNGSVVSGLESYNVSVTVDTATADLNGLTGDTNVVRVDVRVTRGTLVDILLSGYRTNY